MEPHPPDESLQALVGNLNATGAGVRALKSLEVLRRKILIHKNGARRLREAGGLDRLVALLRKGCERVQDSTLSALATCCLEDESCLTVGKLNVSVPLVSIVKTSSRDSIVGRACRLVGNLARQTSNAENLHAAGAVAALLALLERRDDSISYPTLTMLVRAIRLLWMVPEKRDEMLSAGAVRSLSILLTVECESAGLLMETDTQRQPRKSQEELIVALLKCLGYFSTLSTVQCAMQLQGEGKAYECLVTLTRTHGSMALKCLMNICYVSSCRPLLGIAGLVECIVQLLENCPDVEWWPDGAAKTLAQLSEESVNRAQLKHCGGLSLLLTASKSSHHALRALLQYVFDDSALKILIDEGLMKLLSDELTAYLKTMTYDHEHIEDKQVESDYSSKKCDSEARDPSEEVKLSEEQLRKSNSDDANVVIERDNMIVGFVDNASDIEEIDSNEHPLSRKRLHNNKHELKCQVNVQSPEWSSNVYWEPKSPDYGHGSRQLSPSQCKRARWDWSPDSGVGSAEGAASPSWGGWSDASPGSPLSVSSKESKSELYSPVCSETESDGECVGDEDAAEQDEEGEAAADASTALVMHELDELMMDDDDVDTSQIDDAKDGNQTTSSLRIGCVLILWLQVSYRACVVENQACPPDYIVNILTREDYLVSLLDYIDRCRRPRGRAAKILARILSNSLSLMAVLRSGFPMRLHKMTVYSRHPTDKCKQCRQVRHVSKMLASQLSALAESEYGIGEICYTLYKGPLPFKHSLCLTLPYYVRTPKALRRYFVERGGLNMLIAMLDHKEDCIDDNVIALAKLATNFKIRDPKMIEKTYKDCIQIAYDPMCSDLSADELVTFILDDATTVTANKTFLCDNSEVFCAMLTGQFKESAQKCVRLQKVTKDGLEYMLTLLQKGLNEAQCDIRTFPLSERLETSLEALVLADQFLLCKMRSRLRSAIVQFQMSARNVEDVYVWSQNEGMLELWAEAVCFVLVGEMSDKERVRAFSSLLSLQYRGQWLNDVKTLILQHASPEFRESCTAR